MSEDAQSLENLLKEVYEWQLATFPHSNAFSKAKHLESEVKELLEDPSDQGELADCFFLIVGAIMSQGYDIAEIVRAKLEINKARTWGKPDENGVAEHVR